MSPFQNLNFLSSLIVSLCNPSVNCRGAIYGVASPPGYVQALQPSYQIQTWPGVTPPGFPDSGLLIAKVTGLCTPQSPTTAQPTQIQSPYVTLTLGGNCSTANTFLYDANEFFFASWGSTLVNGVTKLDSCCGTYTQLVAENF